MLDDCTIISTLDFRYRKLSLLRRVRLFIRACERAGVSLVLAHADRGTICDHLFRIMTTHLTATSVHIIRIPCGSEGIPNSMLRNQAVQACKTGLLILCDVDVYPDKSLLELMRNETLNEGYSILPVLYLSREGTRQLCRKYDTEAIIETWFSGDSSIGKHLALPSSFMCVKKHDFTIVGGFDEAYIGHGYEDYDFMIRILQKIGNFPKEVGDDRTYKLPLFSMGIRAQLADYCLGHLLRKEIGVHLFHERDRKNYSKERQDNRERFRKKFSIPLKQSGVKGEIPPLIKRFFQLCAELGTAPEDYAALFARPAKKTGCWKFFQ